MSGSLDEDADLFERLCALDGVARAEALAALPDAQRIRVARWLAADDDTGDPIARTVAAAAARLAERRIDRLGPYRLVRELGAGGMGTVFLAERIDGGFAQTVAIKLLRGFPTEDGLRRLRRERSILATLDHPNIARLLDGGETRDGQPWLALEFVDGLPLLEYAARHADSRDARIALVEAMLDAVGHAHQRLVVHRDLKPANVLVGANGEAKLLDFGIARLLEDADDARRTSTRVFSRGYASPEQEAGGAITTASDLYAIGVMLGELISARRALDGSPIDELRALPRDADLAGIVAKATAADPALRYASAGEFRDDLARYRSGFPVRAARMSARYRVGKFVGRHRLAVAGAAAAILAVSAFLWRLAIERERALAAEASARSALAASERDAASARASLRFVTDAFSAAAPARALKREVSVRELLDAAERTLDAAPLAPDADRTLRRLLARLYAELGETKIAYALMQRGLEGAAASDRSGAIALAADDDELARLAAENGAIDAAIAAADAASALRERHAPDDVVESIRTLHTRALIENRRGEDAKAIPLLRDALAKSRSVEVPPDLHSDIAQTLAALLATNEQCEEAVAIAADGLKRLDGRVAEASPERIPLLRAEASALNGCGRPAEAEPILRNAIALQKRVVGDGGADMMELTNELALALNNLGRFRESIEMLKTSDIAMNAAGLGGVDAAISLENYAGLYESAGDYPRALDFYAKARAALDAAGADADHQQRRRMRRSEARTLALAGDTAKARAMLLDLRERALRIDGADSVEYALVVWQLALVARRAHAVDEGLADLDEAMRRWPKLVPPTHPIFAIAHRYRAAFALMRGDVDAADRELGAALAAFAANGAPAFDIAITRSEIAALRFRQRRSAEARRELEAALPVLRDAVLPTEVSRAAAEALATKLGVRI